MLVAKDQRTRQFLNELERRERLDRERRKATSKDRSAMRLACVQFHCDGSKTEIWRN